MSGESVRGGAARKIAGALCLAAAPLFAVMALLAALQDGGAGHAMAGMICAAPPTTLAARLAAGLTGMAPMYLLMSLVHAAPWLRRLARRRSRRPSGPPRA